jgi:hypothetical protein
MSKPIPTQLQNFFGLIFGNRVNLSDVSVETHLPWYVRMFSAPDAITLKTTIYFKDGCYKPNAVSGVTLLGHELYHICQNNGGWFWYLGYVTKAIYWGYKEHPYEKPAYAFGDRLEYLILEAAHRSGVNNPFETDTIPQAFLTQFKIVAVDELKKTLP